MPETGLGRPSALVWFLSRQPGHGPGRRWCRPAVVIKSPGRRRLACRPFDRTRVRFCGGHLLFWLSLTL